MKRRHFLAMGTMAAAGAGCATSTVKGTVAGRAFKTITIAKKVPPAEIKSAADSGFFFMKIKLGQPGTQEEMLAKDTARVSQIHAVLKDCRTPYTKSGKLPYYFYANGRYEKLFHL